MGHFFGTPCIFHQYLSLVLVTSICHQNLSLVFFTSICNFYLSLVLVTSICHQYLSLVMVTSIYHQYLSLVFVTSICHLNPIIIPTELFVLIIYKLYSAFIQYQTCNLSQVFGGQEISAKRDEFCSIYTWGQKSFEQIRKCRHWNFSKRCYQLSMISMITRLLDEEGRIFSDQDPAILC